MHFFVQNRRVGMSEKHFSNIFRMVGLGYILDFEKFQRELPKATPESESFSKLLLNYENPLKCISRRNNSTRNSISRAKTCTNR